MRKKKDEDEIDTLFAEAIKLRDSGELLQAIKKLKEILSTFPEPRGPILGVMAHIYYTIPDLENALICYQETVSISPKSELGSLGLFHTLWDMGREAEAFAEAKRFLALRDSIEYLKLFEEIPNAARKYRNFENDRRQNNH